MTEYRMVIDSIREGVNANQEHFSVVILKEKEAERYLPIWIGGSELESTFLSECIVMGQRGTIIPRPLTHDLICSICYAVGLKVKRVIINKLKDDTYFAKLVLASRDKSYEIDCRPSDALAVAVRVDAPIFADEKVLNKAGVRLGPETGRPISEV